MYLYLQLYSQTHELERLNRELRNWQETSRTAQLSMDNLEAELNRVKTQLDELKENNQDIKSRYAALQAEASFQLCNFISDLC